MRDGVGSLKESADARPETRAAADCAEGSVCCVSFVSGASRAATGGAPWCCAVRYL